MFSLNSKFLYLHHIRFWFSPEFRVLQVAIKEGQKGVTGSVTVQLYRGKVYAVARHAEKALYDPKIASFEETGGFNPVDSEGFIKYVMT
jgi:argininosuccinate synthase